jgi:hypothetical protein
MSEYKRIQKLNWSVCFQEQLEEQIIQNPREVIFHTVASMCDNKHKFRFKKNDEGDFKLTCYGFAFSNFGIKDDKYELEWAADEGDFFDVVQMINSGYQLVEKVVSR